VAKKKPKESAPSFPTVTDAQVEEFERIAGQLTALHQEFAVQAKTKPDNPINKFKLKMINEKLASANALLAGPFKPFEDFEQFDEADLPTNSDVALVLTTYLASLERWRSAHVFNNGYSYYWRTSGPPRLSAVPPSRFKPSDK
jgi:hypothetical protein